MNNIIKIYKNLGSDNKKIRLFIILIFISAVSEIFGIALILPILKIILSTSEFIFINIRREKKVKDPSCRPLVPGFLAFYIIY